MSFWNKVGQVAKAAGEYAAKEAKTQYEGAKERSAQYAEEMPDLSDRQLAKICLTEAQRSPIKAVAARKELRNRGYETMEDIKSI
ncbi:hypothetical protein [Acinetobacter towneri]|uniref:hypothetical protein n=1 Tax=Acinetobacter towneri TaxID=202956 RepID=UPI00209BA4F1|nr:hypothetical protein [Acinetobacter towneri]MCO8055713.1 hypothetical protein [Acinetobacter towneri]